MAKKIKNVVDERLQQWEEFATTHSAQYAMIDADGNLISNNTYDFIGDPENGLAVFKKDGKYGFLRTDGTVAVEPLYDSVSVFNDGLAGVRKDGRWGFINEKGEIIVDPQYEDSASPYFREGLAAVKKNGKYGFIDKEGKEVIAPDYEIAFKFEDGLACVKIDGKYGFIDRTGNLVIPAVYDRVKHDISANMWRDGFAIVEMANKTGLIDRKGEVILPLEYEEVSLFTSMASAKQTVDGETYYDFSVKPNGNGILDKNGVVVEPIYDKIVHFSNGLAAVSKNGKWGYIDTKGNIVLPFEYDKASSFSANYARVTKDNRTYIIDKNGNEICDKIETLMYDTDKPLEGYVAGIKDEKYGLLDESGRFILPCEFDSMEQWGIYPLIEVQKDGKYGVFDLEGKEVIKVEFERIDTPRTEGIPVKVTVKFREKEGVMSPEGKFILNPDEFSSCRVEEQVPVIIVQDQSGKYGLRHYDGSVITQCEYDQISGFEVAGYSIAKKDDLYGLLNSEGKWVIPAEYERIENISEGLIGAKKDGKWGFLNENNEWAIAPAYETVYRGFNNGYAIVMNDGKYILINTKGKELTKPSATLRLYEPAEGMIRFLSGRKYGYLNTEGSIAIKPAFEDAGEFKYGSALVSIKVDKNPMWTFVNKDGVTCEPFENRVFNIGELIPVEKDGKKAMIRPDGSMAVPFVLKKTPNRMSEISVVQLA